MREVPLYRLAQDQSLSREQKQMQSRIPTPNPNTRIPTSVPDPRPQTPVPRPQTPDPRPQTPDPNHHTPNYESMMNLKQLYDLNPKPLSPKTSTLTVGVPTLGPDLGPHVQAARLIGLGCSFRFKPKVYSGTSLMRTRLLLGPYSRTMPMALWGS